MVQNFILVYDERVQSLVERMVEFLRFANIADVDVFVTYSFVVVVVVVDFFKTNFASVLFPVPGVPQLRCFSAALPSLSLSLSSSSHHHHRHPFWLFSSSSFVVDRLHRPPPPPKSLLLFFFVFFVAAIIIFFLHVKQTLEKTESMKRKSACMHFFSFLVVAAVSSVLLDTTQQLF